jgi:hypothetical protein
MQGLRPEWIIPHPDDIDINTRTGEVKFMSPMPRKEKADLDYFYDFNAQLEKSDLRWCALSSKIKSLTREECAT